MKLPKRDKQWWIDRARAEPEADISAGRAGEDAAALSRAVDRHIRVAALVAMGSVKEIARIFNVKPEDVIRALEEAAGSKHRGGPTE